MKKRLLAICLTIYLSLPFSQVRAQEKSVDALERIGQCYEGRLSECEKCFPTGQSHSPFTDTVEKYRIKAEEGSTLPQLLLGSRYALGEGTEKNYAEAYYWLTLAANRGDICGDDLRKEVSRHLTPEQRTTVQKRLLKWTQEDLGLCGNNRISPTAMGGSFEEAVKRYHEKAKVTGDMSASSSPREMLGALYAKGLGVPRNDGEAYYWLTLASIDGSMCGATLLKGIEQRLSAEQLFDVRERLLKKILEEARYGNGRAQLSASRFYENGWGTHRDYTEAYFWYRVASKFSDFLVHTLEKASDTASEHLTEAQVAEVEKRLKTWKHPDYVEVDGELYYMQMFKTDSGNAGRIASFNKDMLDPRMRSQITDARITTCTTIIDLPVGTARGNHSYGGICSLEHKNGEIEQVMICNDEMVGHFRIEPTKSAHVEVHALGEFVATNCFGG